MTGFDRLDNALILSGVVFWLCVLAAAPALIATVRSAWNWSEFKARLVRQMKGLE